MKLYKHTNGKCNILGTKIRSLRKSADLPQEQLAAKLYRAGLNLNQKAISRIETGERVVPDQSPNLYSTTSTVIYRMRAVVGTSL